MSEELKPTQEEQDFAYDVLRIDNFCRAGDIDLEAVVDFIANKRSPWISVEDRLPEEEGIYLTKYRGDKRQQLDERMWIRSYPFWGIFKGNWTHKKQTKYSVTHWMPIPKLPKATQ